MRESDCVANCGYDFTDQDYRDLEHHGHIVCPNCHTDNTFDSLYAPAWSHVAKPQWVKTASNLMYHVAPRSARESIQAHGIDRSLGTSQWGDDPLIPKATYLWHYPEDAEDYQEQMGNHDLWEAEMSGLNHEEDPKTYSASMTYDPVPPNRLRLLTDERMGKTASGLSDESYALPNANKPWHDPDFIAAADRGIGQAGDEQQLQYMNFSFGHNPQTGAIHVSQPGQSHMIGENGQTLEQKMMEGGGVTPEQASHMHGSAFAHGPNVDITWPTHGQTSEAAKQEIRNQLNQRIDAQRMHFYNPYDTNYDGDWHNRNDALRQEREDAWWDQQDALQVPGNPEPGSDAWHDYMEEQERPFIDEWMRKRYSSLTDERTAAADTIRLYRGIGNTNNWNDENTGGWFTDSWQGARGYAADDNSVVAVDVPRAVADQFLSPYRTLGAKEWILPPEWAAKATPATMHGPERYDPFEAFADERTSGWERTTMALDPDALQRHIQQYGPYGYHDTGPENFDSIEQHGIRYDPEMFDSGYGGNVHGRNYMFVPRGKQPMEGSEPYRIDLRKLDPTKFGFDEDHVHLLPSWEPIDSNDRDRLPKMFERHPELDESPYVEKSMARGSLSYLDTIPPDAIERNPVWWGRQNNLDLVQRHQESVLEGQRMNNEWFDKNQQLGTGGIVGRHGEHGWDSEGNVYQIVPPSEKYPHGMHIPVQAPDAEVEQEMNRHGISSPYFQKMRKTFLPDEKTAAIPPTDPYYEAHDLLHNEGGFTLDKNTLKPWTGGGFGVALPGYETIHPQVTPDNIRELHYKALQHPNPNVHMGGWYDGQSGNTYLDLAEIHPELDTAMQVARARKQLAIWDFNKNQEIRLDEPKAMWVSSEQWEPGWLKWLRLTHAPHTSSYDFDMHVTPFAEPEDLDVDYAKRTPFIVHDHQVYFGPTGDHHTAIENTLGITPMTSQIHGSIYGGTPYAQHTTMPPDQTYQWLEHAKRLHESGEWANHRVGSAPEDADTPDPDYAFVYYRSGLEIVEWEHNVRYRNLADQLLERFNLDKGDMGWMDDSDDWTGGDVYDEKDGLRVEFKQLAPPAIQTEALYAIEAWFADR